jgi:hypothetical protein
MAKNTHELIVLPVFGRFFRPNSLACGSGELETLSGKLRAASTPSDLLLGKRYPSEPWPGVFGFHSFDPDRISAADLRYTSARESTADWLGSRDARQTTQRTCESRANFARASSCARRKDTFHRPETSGEHNFDQCESERGSSFQTERFIAANGRIRSHTICFCITLPKRSISIYCTGLR